MTAKSNAREGDGVADDLILQAVARGWSAPENAHKEMDATLAVAIAAEVRAALQAQQGAEPVAWQPIETAPFNTVVWLWNGDHFAVGARRQDGPYKGEWLDYMEHSGGPAFNDPPTHWQPLPGAPR